METGIKAKAVHSLIDKSLGQNPEHSYHLSIEAGDNSLTFCVLDRKSNKYLALESYRFEKSHSPRQTADKVGELLKQSPLVKRTYKSVSAAIISRQSTLVPESLYKKEVKDRYLKLNHQLLDTEKIHAEKLQNIDAYMVYTSDDTLRQTLQKQFPGITLKHASSTLIDALLIQHKNEAEPGFIAHVYPTHFELVHINKRKLIYYNSFEYQSREDFLYFLLFTAEQLGLNPESMELLLTGEVKKQSPLYELLYTYIRYISFGKRPEGFRYSHVLDEVPANFHFNLFSQFLCVS